MSDKRIADAIQHGIDNARIAANKPRGYFETCFWCGDPTISGAKYCCKDCADDHEKYERLGGA